MKSTFGLLVCLLLLASAACGPQKDDKQVVEIDPLSPQEARLIQQSLLTGRSLDDLNLDESLPENSTDCPVPEISGLNVQGYVQVPEDYENPQGRQIQVFYYGRLQAGREPVVFYNGGPASDSHGSAEVIDSVLQSKKLSFLYIDQRGTGCSAPFPVEANPETIERLTHYTSTEIVKDSEVVREKLLGAQGQWKIFGQSYGGLIVHRYSMVAPKSVKAAYAHGFSLMEDQTDWLKLRIKSQKRVSELYFEKYPQDRKDLGEIRSLIPENLCFTDNGTEVCGPKMMDALTIYLGFTTSWASLHTTIDRILAEDRELAMDHLETFVRRIVFGVYNNNGLAGSVISVMEISGGGSDAETCMIVQNKLTEEGENPDEWLFNECRLLAGMKNDKWAELLAGVTARKQMTPLMLKKTLSANPKLPFYLYAGEKDVFVPIETFKEEVAMMGSLITYRQFSDSGHEGFYTEPLVWKDLLTLH